MHIEPGSKWRHRRTGNLYVIGDLVPIKLGDEWIDDGAVIYITHRGLDSFVRLTHDFLENFEEVTE